MCNDSTARVYLDLADHAEGREAGSGADVNGCVGGLQVGVDEGLVAHDLGPVPGVLCREGAASQRSRRDAAKVHSGLAQRRLRDGWYPGLV